jgi:hypothetical protein
VGWPHPFALKALSFPSSNDPTYTTPFEMVGEEAKMLPPTCPTHF